MAGALDWSPDRTQREVEGWQRPGRRGPRSRGRARGRPRAGGVPRDARRARRRRGAAVSALVLGLDQGTSSTRCVALDEELRERGVGSVAGRLVVPRPRGSSSRTRRRSRRRRSRRSPGRCPPPGRRPGDVAALGIANQTETFVVWERDSGRPVHPAIVWQDRRTDAACAELREHEAMVRERTGLELDATFPATKLRWVLDQVERRGPRLRRRGVVAARAARRRARVRRRQRRALAAVPARRDRVGRRAARAVRHPARAAAADRGLGRDRRDDRRRPGARRGRRPAGVAVRAALLGARHRQGHARHRRVRARAGGGDAARAARRHPRLVRLAARGRHELRARGLHPDGRRGARLVRADRRAPGRAGARRAAARVGARRPSSACPRCRASAARPGTRARAARCSG